MLFRSGQPKFEDVGNPRDRCRFGHAPKFTAARNGSTAKFQVACYSYQLAVSLHRRMKKAKGLSMVTEADYLPQSGTTMNSARDNLSEQRPCLRSTEDDAPG